MIKAGTTLYINYNSIFTSDKYRKNKRQSKYVSLMLSLSTLASKRLGATPALHVSPVSLWILSLSSSATFGKKYSSQINDNIRRTPRN